MRIEEGFHQEQPPVLHPFLDDPVLPTLVKRFFPESSQAQVTQELVDFGNDVNGYIRQLGTTAAPPTLTQYNHFGQRIDKLQTSEGWRGLKEVAAKEGIVSTAYERNAHGALARVLMFLKVLIWNGDSHEVGCPMAMTDGAARVLEVIGTPHMKQYLLPRLLTRDPRSAYTAGQWMTERPGGSDVSHTETTAQPLWQNGKLESGAPYRLSGVKWFSSATDGQVALALAQVIDNPAHPNGTSTNATSHGLGLFVIPLPDADTTLFTPNANALPFQPRNGISIHRLKNKIGTHALPTAELTLDSTIGFLLIVPPRTGVPLTSTPPVPAWTPHANQVSHLNGLIKTSHSNSPAEKPNQKLGAGFKPNGVRAIAPVLNITRIHSASASIGYLARCLDIARSYAHVRRVAGTASAAGASKSGFSAQVLLVDVPLHMATLARVEVLRRALVHFFFGVVRLLGVAEAAHSGTEDERRRLRLLTPVLKAFAADRAVGGMEECMAALGGLGYMEETGIGRLIRDALVEKIWEGTINVLALDMMRAAREDGGAPIKDFCEWSRAIIAQYPFSESNGQRNGAHAALVNALTVLESLFPQDSHAIQTLPPVLARPALLLMAQIASTSYLLEHAVWSRLPADAIIANRWIEEGGLAESVRDVKLAQDEQRHMWDKEIVYAQRPKL